MFIIDISHYFLSTTHRSIRLPLKSSKMSLKIILMGERMSSESRVTVSAACPHLLVAEISSPGTDVASLALQGLEASFEGSG